MKREPVDSSMFASIGYDPDQQILELEFNSGKVYQYFDVPLETYQEMMASSSKGGFFRAEINDFFEYSEIKQRRRNR